MANRLAHVTSPYLSQHADNPVDWWPWGEAAWAEARRRDVPVFLSVGYAACHWCHVMAHESFEDEDTAAVLNEGFVAVKVDREEHPDVDQVYMTATQALTGQGGWPMSVFCTPEGRPFHAGTYFPPRPAHGLPSFTQVLDAVAQAWRERREEVVQSSGQITAELARLAAVAAPRTVDAAGLAEVRQTLTRSFDPLRGGFGGAPKFPPTMLLEGLLRLGDEASTEQVELTCRAMAQGGMYDQLGGGFARYSVDADWVVPHFEKMLYDNALLLGVYTHWWRRSRDPLAERVVRETVGWLRREMLTAGGAFTASLDADSPDPGLLGTPGRSREGAYYVWDPAGLVAVLGETDGAWVGEVCRVEARGSFEDGTSTLQLGGDVDHRRWVPLRDRLRTARDERPRPARDDKVVAAWNGWLVASLVEAAGVFDEPAWLGLAERALDHVWAVHRVEGRLRRVSRDGVVGEAPAVLEDHAALLLATSRLAAARASGVWLERAEWLAAELDSFAAPDGGFHDTREDVLYLRARELADNATPSGSSTVVHALAELGRLTGDPEPGERAARAAAVGGQLLVQSPRFAGWWLAEAATRLGAGAVEVAVVGPPEDPATVELALTARREGPAGSVVVVGRPDAEGMPLLAGRPLVGDRPAAYVCRGFVCARPVTDPAALTALLATP